MKLPALTFALICFFTWTKSTKAQNGEFKALSHVDVVVKGLGKTDEEIGLTAKSIEDRVIVEVKRDIPKLQIESSSLLSYVDIEVTSMRTATNTVSTIVLVGLVRPVQIIGDDGSKERSWGMVWKQGTVLSGPTEDMASRVREQISVELAAFAAAYYKDNP